MRYISALATTLLALHHSASALMDPSLYKNVITSRNLTYHYYFSPAQPQKPTLLFCHGFPSTIHDWRHIAPQLQGKGYGVVVPDMLGYGETAKPTDPAAGSKAVSRLANYYPERFLAYAFFAVPFMKITPPINFQIYLDYLKQLYGYEIYAYWTFFSAPDANEVLQAHIDSFVSLIYPYDPTIWKARFAPTGAMRGSLLEDYVTPRPSYVSEEDKKHFIETFRRNGFEAPTCWYKIMTSQLSAKDEEQVPYERLLPPASAPIYFGAAKYDYVCLPEIGYTLFGGDSFSKHNVTEKEYDADHWLILSNGDEIARDLDAWIESIVVAKAN
ncbi:uncharacterized protein PHACADRAFT_194943 [Phanerochaete carnosa HHB-10118-sp]|uniref:AB hydrolase-1 domain-containing protein n=1 Tax=Phanerochaete carnosa (strain HHB-10118-sp) TaxID=650164 RepID=K5WDQ1_PHACS|nr:uncharacterized protein PHACADRAFT_194943 [Phanerochaete carnosa HHB-10118-sp]EKM57395.1 hypothetical protein PHACADRAFT_194943 [Phanerochaete carnosa HHB-10118-sp]